MAQNNSKPNQEGSKIDIQTVLNRRRRTVKQYLNSQVNVKNLEDLKSHFDFLSKDYLLSEDFKQKCYDYVSSLSKKTEAPVASLVEERGKEEIKPLLDEPDSSEVKPVLPAKKKRKNKPKN